MPRPRRSAPEGGRPPRTLRTRPPPGFPRSCRKSAAPSARSAHGCRRTPGPDSGRRRTFRSRATEPRWSPQILSPSSAHRPLLRPCDAPGPASAAAAPPCPPRRRSHSGLVGLRTRTDRRIPPLADTAGDDSADAARGLPPPKSQIPTWTGSRRRLRSSGGFGQAAATRLPVNRSAPLAVRDPRHRRAAQSPLPYHGAAARHGPQRP